MTQAKPLLDILDFWHKVEFFIPFDLKQVFDQINEKDLKWLRPDDLRPGAPSPWQVVVPEDRQLVGFKLYLGIFDMQVIADFAGQLSADDAADSTEEAERTLDGQSCIARIGFDVHGESEFDPLSVSTVPWAIGKAQREGLPSLTSEAFATARKDLSERLFNYKTERLRRRLNGRDDAQPMPLTGDEIRSLHALLVDWAGCALPPQSSIALIQILTREKKDDKQTTHTAPATNGENAPSDAQPSALPNTEDEADDEGGDTAAEEPTVDILNSFYIEDIERCMTSIRDGDIPETIRAYLTPGDATQRVDLYSDAGHAEIVRALHPTKTNSGHWPEDSSQKMSLMQQFAINTAFERLKSEGVFSVNGPPGTGKTTLLRDMICENVVRRARELARLVNAADGLVKTGTRIPFVDGNTATIRTLVPELTGFEMVVASSNNAAVENISTDLPKSKRLGESWRDVRYLQPVAHKVAAQVGETNYTKLAPLDVPWGMISCALGNAKNRRRFRERFFDDRRPAGERGGPNDPCAIWDWLKRYSGPTFQEAKRTFLDADAMLQAAIRERLHYAELHAAWADTSKDRFTQPAMDALAEADRCRHDAFSKSEERKAATVAAENKLADLREEERLLDRAGPGFFAKLFRTGSARQHAVDVAQNAHAQIDARRSVARCRADADTAAEALRNAQLQTRHAQVALDAASSTWHEKHSELTRYREHFVDLTLPGNPNQIETDDVQQDGYWQDAELTQLRTRIVVAALALHEAWFASVAKTGGAGFGGNLFAINKLLHGTPLENPADAKLIWQSLFMIVPVVSTTFASFARQFRGMGPGSIGWLFIDEAGQAVPQAAVGALWRARRAMVVGDPLQIEPVFTVPTRLINALADLSPHSSDGRSSPARVSVQRLADDANPFGTYMPMEGAAPLWIGSPLRVHRRCVDPMFSIANRIAYEGKMVFGLKSRKPSKDDLNPGDSAWVDVRGKTSEKQVVPAQIDVVAELIVRLYAASGELPPLYVISPFKAIKGAIVSRLKRIDWRAVTEDAPPKKAWGKWCRERIGTVHTFQGKEESVVIFVLGADHDNEGSANWAASKPNLLNVAVTRAQHRIFIIGDASLWGGLKHFSEALSQLKTPITAEQWLGRIGAVTGHDRPDITSDITM
ncbi:DEAD/DEAH box helicase [Paraburkholderia ferrariae]|uniref:DEAD/DEAH box helicase n=1 Tax=Paraburkholderia ferrariae TaxID=386056 RepID=UPI0005A84E6B|nr:AAA domain-containing protein [Paraburkholderia ferrariae]